MANAFPVFGGAGTGTRHFQVTAVNKGKAAGSVMAWGLRLPDGSDIVQLRPGWSDQPGPIQAHGGRLKFYMEASDVIATCKQRGVEVRDLVPWVQLGTGKRVTGRALPYDG